MREKLAEAMVVAERDGPPTRLATLRLIIAAIQDRDIAMRADPGASDGAGLAPEAAILQLLGTMIKQRQESVRGYEEAGRLDLADRERAEIAVIEEFLPQPLSEAEAEQAVAETISEIGADDLRDLGRVMARLKAKYAGRMDFGLAGMVAKNSLT